MTGAELRDYTAETLGGTQLGETYFYQNANMQKDLLEAKRDWMILRAFDSSISFATSDDYQSTKTLPDRFARIYTPYDSLNGNQPAVALIDSAGNRTPLNPIPFASRYAKKDEAGYYYLDVKNGKIGRTGSLAGTLHLYFIQNTADLDDNRTWEFPDYAHPLLAFRIAITWKGGADFDTVSAFQMPFNREDAAAIESRLAMWDAQLQQQEIGV